METNKLSKNNTKPNTTQRGQYKKLIQTKINGKLKERKIKNYTDVYNKSFTIASGVGSCLVEIPHILNSDESKFTKTLKIGKKTGILAYDIVSNTEIGLKAKEKGMELGKELIVKKLAKYRNLKRSNTTVDNKLNNSKINLSNVGEKIFDNIGTLYSVGDCTYNCIKYGTSKALTKEETAIACTKYVAKTFAPTLYTTLFSEIGFNLGLSFGIVSGPAVPIIAGLGGLLGGVIGTLVSISLKEEPLVIKNINGEIYQEKGTNPGISWENVHRDTKCFGLEMSDNNSNEARWRVINIPCQTRNIRKNSHKIGETVIPYKGASKGSKTSKIFLYAFTYEKEKKEMNKDDWNSEFFKKYCLQSAEISINIIDD